MYLSKIAVAAGTPWPAATMSGWSSLGGPYGVSRAIVVVGRSRPWWQVKHVTDWTPEKLVLLMVETISTILRAVFFLGVSKTQSTLSEPAEGWQSAQS